jgi:hypothetical protein
MIEQLSLFETPLLHIETGNVIVSDTVAVEEIDHSDLKKLPKGKYKIHSTGGFHFFKDVEEAEDIFKEQIWPWLEVIQENKRNTKKYMVMPRIMPGKGFYSQVTLIGKNSEFNIKMTMHKLVCLAFNKNPNPLTHLLVNHINGNKVDYRADNLEWTTHALNSVGPTLKSRLPAEKVYRMWKDSLYYEIE